MSLDYDMTKIPNKFCWQELDGDEPTKDTDMDAITHMLIFAGMSIGMNEITEENHREWGIRLRVTDALLGHSIYDTRIQDATGKELSKKGRSMTLDEIKNRIGLRTNAPSHGKGPAFGRRKWLSRWFFYVMTDKVNQRKENDEDSA